MSCFQNTHLTLLAGTLIRPLSFLWTQKISLHQMPGHGFQTKSTNSHQHYMTRFVTNTPISKHFPNTGPPTTRIEPDLTTFCTPPNLHQPTPFWTPTSRLQIFLQTTTQRSLHAQHQSYPHLLHSHNQDLFFGGSAKMKYTSSSIFFLL